jgi:nitrite reductase/ring-hydroxylating ferredoxin subunit
VNLAHPTPAAPLADGVVTGSLIECPKHAGCFDLTTGLPMSLRLKMAP